MDLRGAGDSGGGGFAAGLKARRLSPAAVAAYADWPGRFAKWLGESAGKDLAAAGQVDGRRVRFAAAHHPQTSNGHRRDGCAAGMVKAAKWPGMGDEDAAEGGRYNSQGHQPPIPG